MQYGGGSGSVQYGGGSGGVKNGGGSGSVQYGGGILNFANLFCVCAGGGCKLDFFLSFYFTARQQTFPENQLLEAWPASIYGHLRECMVSRESADSNVVFI